MIRIVLKDFKTTSSIRVKDGTDTFVHPFKLEIEHDGALNDPVLLIKILENFIASIKAETQQTKLLPTDGHPVGSQEAKKAADAANAAAKKSLGAELKDQGGKKGGGKGKDTEKPPASTTPAK